MRYYAQILVEIPAKTDREAIEAANRFVDDLRKLDSVDQPSLNEVNKQHRLETETIYSKFGKP